MNLFFQHRPSLFSTFECNRKYRLIDIVRVHNKFRDQWPSIGRWSNLGDDQPAKAHNKEYTSNSAPDLSSLRDVSPVILETRRAEQMLKTSRIVAYR